MKGKVLLTVLFVFAIGLSGCLEEVAELGAIGPVLDLVKTDPLDEAKGGISDAMQMPGLLMESRKVGFSEGYSLRTTSIEERIAIAHEQVCLSLGDFASSSDFQLTQSEIKYTGKGVNAKLKVLCNVNEEDLIESINAEGLGAGGSVQRCEDTCVSGKCCLIFLSKAS